MFFLQKKSPVDHKKLIPENVAKIVVKIDGLHCTSCSLLIDNTLEDLPGVISSSTSYAKSECIVSFDAEQCSISAIEQTISELGYAVVHPQMP